MWDIVQTDTYYDPFPQYIYLGADVTDGILAWVQIGVNTSANYVNDEYYTVAAYIDADGGHVNVDYTFVGGRGDMGGNGTMNGTAMTTGAAPQEPDQGDIFSKVAFSSVYWETNTRE